jgi:hypothetical protein
MVKFKLSPTKVLYAFPISHQAPCPALHTLPNLTDLTILGELCKLQNSLIYNKGKGEIVPVLN